MTLEEQVMAMLDALRPMLQADGGDLEFVKMEGTRWSRSSSWATAVRVRTR